MAKVHVSEEAASRPATATAGEASFSQEVMPYLSRLNRIQGEATARLQKTVEEAQHRFALEALAEAFDLGFKTALEEAVRNPKLLDRYRVQPHTRTTP